MHLPFLQNPKLQTATDIWFFCSTEAIRDIHLSGSMEVNLSMPFRGVKSAKCSPNWVTDDKQI